MGEVRVQELCPVLSTRESCGKTHLYRKLGFVETNEWEEDNRLLSAASSWRDLMMENRHTRTCHQRNLWYNGPAPVINDSRSNREQVRHAGA
jgi:hypothetical protein